MSYMKYNTTQFFYPIVLYMLQVPNRHILRIVHPLNLNLVDVRFDVRDTPPSVRIEAETRTTGPTGVEMEAIIAAQTAAAVIYDMCKAVQRDIVISRVRLLFKDGGRSGAFHAKPMD